MSVKSGKVHVISHVGGGNIAPGFFKFKFNVKICAVHVVL